MLLKSSLLSILLLTQMWTTLPQRDPFVFPPPPSVDEQWYWDNCIALGSMPIQSTFALFNKCYFEDKLPKVRVRYAYKGRIKKEELFAVTEHDARGFHITLNSHYRDAETLMQFTLLHEMVHVKLWWRCPDLGPGGCGHGALFQAEMLRLAKQGAFRDLW